MDKPSGSAMRRPRSGFSFSTGKSHTGRSYYQSFWHAGAAVEASDALDGVGALFHQARQVFAFNV
jgi:hypothetical protein